MAKTYKAAAIAYAALLLIFTGYLMLDTFVLGSAKQAGTSEMNLSLFADGTTVNGTVHLDGGTVSLAGAVSSLVPGTYTILSADAIVDGGGSWTLPALRRFLFSISVTGTEVRLTVSKHGLMMLVK